MSVLERLKSFRPRRRSAQETRVPRQKPGNQSNDLFAQKTNNHSEKSPTSMCLRYRLIGRRKVASNDSTKQWKESTTRFRSFLVRSTRAGVCLLLVGSFSNSSRASPL